MASKAAAATCINVLRRDPRCACVRAHHCTTESHVWRDCQVDVTLDVATRPDGRVSTRVASGECETRRLAQCVFCSAERTDCELPVFTIVTP